MPLRFWTGPILIEFVFGIGAYRIDLHPSTAGRNYVDISSLPFQIPLGALIPQRVENLVAGCKNIGTTHLTNGCYRLHPVEWTIGEAAGALVARARETGEPPRRIRSDAKQLAAFQQSLRAGLVRAQRLIGHVPAHRVGQPVVDVEQIGDVDGVRQRFPVDSRRQYRPRIVWRQRLRLERHLAQESQRRFQFRVNGRRL